MLMTFQLNSKTPPPVVSQGHSEVGATGESCGSGEHTSMEGGQELGCFDKMATHT